MSTDYATLKKVHIDDLLDGRLEEFGIRECDSIWTTDASICLTDGQSCLWVELYEDGFVMMITRYGLNDPDKILRAIAEVFDTEIVSEQEPQFWGYDTQEQFDAAMKQIAKEHQDEFYQDLLNFLSGKPHGFKRGSIGEIEAKIAKRLVEADCTLVQPERREEFLNKIHEIHSREQDTGCRPW